MFKKEFGAKRTGGFGGPRKSFGDRPSYGAPRAGGFSGPRKSFGAGGYGAGAGGYEDRPSFEAVCDVCSKDCRVPFRPNGSKPVLCTNCFRKEKGAETTYAGKRSFAGRDDAGEGVRGAFGKPYGAPKSDAGLEARLKGLEAKVDRILKLLGGDESEANKA